MNKDIVNIKIAYNYILNHYKKEAIKYLYIYCFTNNNNKYFKKYKCTDEGIESLINDYLSLKNKYNYISIGFSYDTNTSFGDIDILTIKKDA